MDHSRQLGIVRPETLHTPIHIIGCGSVGSWTALTLAKTGCDWLTLWDFDTVEAHNIPNQAYRPTDIGRPKVEALAELIESMTGYRPEVVPRRCDGRCEGIAIVAVDSMDVRLDLWRQLRTVADWIVDARMGAEIATIHTCRTSDSQSISAYRKTLYPSSEAYHAPCTARATAYCAVGLAGIVASVIKAIAVKQTVPSELAIAFRAWQMTTTP